MRGWLVRDERGHLGLITAHRATETGAWLGILLEDVTWDYNGNGPFEAKIAEDEREPPL